MDRESYAELVEYMADRFGQSAMDAWSQAARIYPDFSLLDGECVWEALLAKLDSGAEFPPKPPALRAAAIERMRHKPRPELPESTERYDWPEHSRRTYGKVRPIWEVILEVADV